MGDPVSQLTTAVAGLFAGKKAKDYLTPELPEAPELPAPVEEVDASGQRAYTKARLKRNKGRASTILASKKSPKKTVLG